MKRETDVFHGRRAIIFGLVAFVLGGLGLGLAVATQSPNVFHAYLVAYAWALSTILGALLFLMITHAMDAKWPVAVRRIVEGIVAVLPLAAVAFIPIAIGTKNLYPWANAATETDPAALKLRLHQHAYLNPSSFLTRAIVYFIIWLAVGSLLRQWSTRQDEVADSSLSLRARILSAVGLFPVGLALTFASFDWLMSLLPAWYSTMFGVYWFSGGFLASLSLVVVVLAALRGAGSASWVTRGHYYALGRLLLTFTIFWAYAGYFQLFLIWIADKPHEVVFYALRSTPGWSSFSIALAIVHFVVPFFVLLSYRVKQSPRTLAPVAAWLLLAHWMDMQWLVMPTVRPAAPLIHWVDVAAAICIGGAFFAFGAFRLRGRALIPQNDPSLEVGLRYEGH